MEKILFSANQIIHCLCLEPLKCMFVCLEFSGSLPELSYVLYSERELKPFNVETEYWQYVNRTEDNIFLLERGALKESDWIDHTGLLSPHCIQ